ncbi:DegT/DnrJ/EryC1/StrS family aminotransferase [Kordiimonas sp.]|uniref:DegT/DnrJ/EryC1/StrS family aminotransferase n=1 Tax=Kordiimonas sp. TaxID=1970157 RepID=UPI003B51FEB7
MSGPRGMNIPIARTSLTEMEINSVLEPLRSGWLVQGTQVAAFEKAWNEFTGSKHSIAVTSCTTALHLSVAALGLGPGDEVIVPAFTWIATANVVEHQGATVVFCDIDLNTFNLDTEALEAAITPRTKGVIPVHLFGLAAEMDAINKIAANAGLWVVEDAACGFGGTYKGRHLGTLGDAGAFSFHPRKSITTGEGGMITVQDDELATRLRRLRDHGAALSDLQRHLGPKPYLLADHPDAGYNQRMTDIQGALGRSQMERADDILSERRRLSKVYDQAFAELDWLQTPTVPEGCEHGYQSYPCLFKPEAITLDSIERIHEMRNAWMEKLQQNGVSTRPATHAVHMLSFYANKYGLKVEDFPNAYAAAQCSISLPLFHGLTDEEQAYVIAQVKEGCR